MSLLELLIAAKNKNKMLQELCPTLSMSNEVMSNRVMNEFQNCLDCEVHRQLAKM